MLIQYSNKNLLSAKAIEIKKVCCVIHHKPRHSETKLVVKKAWRINVHALLEIYQEIIQIVLSEKLIR
jgi:hypothetical protein